MLVLLKLTHARYQQGREWGGMMKQKKKKVWGVVRSDVIPLFHVKTESRRLCDFTSLPVTFSFQRQKPSEYLWESANSMWRTAEKKPWFFTLPQCQLLLGFTLFKLLKSCFPGGLQLTRSRGRGAKAAVAVIEESAKRGKHGFARRDLKNKREETLQHREVVLT